MSDDKELNGELDISLEKFNNVLKLEESNDQSHNHQSVTNNIVSPQPKKKATKLKKSAKSNTESNTESNTVSHKESDKELHTTENKEPTNEVPANEERWNSEMILAHVSKIIHRSRDPLLLELRSNTLLYLDRLINEFPVFFDKFPNLFAKVAMGMTEEYMEQLAEILAVEDSIAAGEISREKAQFILGSKLINKHAPHLLDKTKQCPK